MREKDPVTTPGIQCLGWHAKMGDREAQDV